MGCLKVLEKKFFINIGHPNLFIRNSKAHAMISVREKDFNLTSKTSKILITLYRIDIIIVLSIIRR